MVVFFVKSNENTYPKGSALMKMYRVVPQTKRGNLHAPGLTARLLFHATDVPSSFLRPQPLVPTTEEKLFLRLTVN